MKNKLRGGDKIEKDFIGIIDKINQKKLELNNVLDKNQSNTINVLIHSQELDKLIIQYYRKIKEVKK